MIKFKNILLIAVALVFFSCNNYEEGYKFIENAKTAIAQNDLALAESYIEKAIKSNYGPCGNAWIDAKVDIDLVKVQILQKKEKYNEALELLDAMHGCNFGEDCHQRDVLKIETLFLKHGKDKVVKTFQLNSEIKKHVDEQGITSYSINLKELKYVFTFGEYLPRVTYDENQQPILHEAKDASFESLAKACGFYSLLKS